MFVLTIRFHCSSFMKVLKVFCPFFPTGIDDMFVIIQSWSNLINDEEKATETHSPIIKNGSPKRGNTSEEEEQQKFEDRFGRCLQHSGVSITVTSLTDFLAFMVGATTILPALKSFCIYCGVGILIVYFLQASWFVAWMVIDQKRMEANRNGFMPCIKHKEANTQCCGGSAAPKDQMAALQQGFQAYGKYLMKLPSKIAVIAVTVLIFSVSIWGNVLLKQKFDPMWFLPLDSYLVSWHNANEQ